MENMTPQIYQAMANVMADVQAVGKNSKNKDQGFDYRGIDDVMNELHDSMVKHKVICVPTVLHREEEKKIVKSGAEWTHAKLEIAYDFYTTDGSHLRSVVIGEGMDSSDKASNKAMAVGLKYSLTQTFMIPTNEEKDPDADTPPDTVANTATSTKQTEVADDKSKEIKRLYALVGKWNTKRNIQENTSDTVTKMAVKAGYSRIGEMEARDVKSLADQLQKQYDL